VTRPGSFRFRGPIFALGALLCFAGVTAPAWAQFETRATHLLPNESFVVGAGDFNRDGRLDIAVLDSDGVSILLGNGDGTFAAPVTYTAGLAYSMAVADFNGDGLLDIVVANLGPSTVEVFLGNGDGTFQLPISSSTSAGSYFVAVGDFNNDKVPDLAIIDPPYISVLLGKGDGTFGAPIDNDSFLGPHQLAVGDFNNDHKLDVAVVGYFGGSQDLGILLGNGDGTLQSSLTSPLTYLPVFVAAADFNMDGKLDVAIGDGGGRVTVLLGKGDGSFQPPELYSGGGGYVIAGDFNRDGKLDLIAGAVVGPGVAEFLGNGDGTFQQARIYLSGSGVLAAAGDLNGDHAPDMVLLDGNHAKVTTMLNTGALSFSPSTPLHFWAQALNTKSAPQSVTLTNTGAVAVSVRSVGSSGQFQVSNDCNGTIAAGASCAVTIVSAPTTLGNHSGLVTILDSASTKPQIIELSGRGTQVELSPNPLSFAPEKVGTTSPPKQLSITNGGNTSLIISGVGIGGANARDFAVSGVSNCTAQELAPGAACKVTITFSPKKAGSRSASIFVSDSGKGSPETGSLSGTGT
jgi:hypothetical protein